MEAAEVKGVGSMTLEAMMEELKREQRQIKTEQEQLMSQIAEFKIWFNGNEFIQYMLKEMR